MTSVERARRVRAARELAGYRTPDALAAAMKEAKIRGFSYGTIKAWETETHEQDVLDYKLDKLAEFCGLAPAFFTVDFSRLSPPVAGGQAQAPPGALGQTAQDSQTTPARKPRSETRKVRGRKRAAG